MIDVLQAGILICASVVSFFRVVGWLFVVTSGEASIATPVGFCSALDCLLEIQALTLLGGINVFGLCHLWLKKAVISFSNLIFLMENVGSSFVNQSLGAKTEGHIRQKTLFVPPSLWKSGIHIHFALLKVWIALSLIHL